MRLLKSLLFLIPFLPFSYSQAQCQDESPFYWKISPAYGTKLLAPCGGNYNCHLFAKSYFEGYCRISWNTPQTSPYTCPETWGAAQQPPLGGSPDQTIYQNSNKYVRVCNESDADIAFYKFSSAGEHSAVREELGGGAVKYLSKYGVGGPVIGHDLHTTWYELSGQYTTQPIQYWVYAGIFVGSSTITGSTPKQYSITNKNGVSYSWSIVSGGSNAYISSGQNSNVVSVTPTHSGTAVLRLTMSSGCGGSAIQEKTLTIQTGSCLEGSYYVNGGPTSNLNTYNSIATGGVYASVSCSYSNTFEWQKTGGTINSYFPSYNGSYVTFTMPSGGSISFNVKAKNGGTIVYSRNVTFNNYGSYLVYPNPASSTMSIDLNEDTEFSITMTSLEESQIEHSIDKYCGKSPINVSNLKPGRYILKVYHNQELINQQQIRIKKHE